VQCREARRIVPEPADVSVPPDQVPQNAHLEVDRVHPEGAGLHREGTVSNPAFWGTGGLREPTSAIRSRSGRLAP